MGNTSGCCREEDEGDQISLALINPQPDNDEGQQVRRPELHKRLDDYKRENAASTLKNYISSLSTDNYLHDVDDEGRNGLHYFITIVDRDWDANPILDVLLSENRFTIDVKTGKKGYYPIHFAAIHSKLNILKRLLQQRKEEQCRYTDANLDTALHIAVTSRNRTIPESKLCLIELLQADGTCVNFINKDGKSPVHIFVSEPRETGDGLIFNKMLENYKDDLAIDNGLDYDIVDGVQPLLHLFSCVYCSEGQKELLTATMAKAEILTRVNDKWNGTTPLENAVINNDAYVVQKLLELPSVKLNTRTEEGKRRNAMFYAALRDNDCLKLLMTKYGEDNGYQRNNILDDRDSLGKTVLEYMEYTCSLQTLWKMLDLVLPIHALTGPQTDMLFDDELRRLFERNPKTIFYLMEHSFYYKSKNNTLNPLVCNLSAVTGIRKKSHKEITELNRKKQTDKNIKISTPETEHLRSSLHRWRYPERKQLLRHPAMKLFLFEKYRLNWIPISCLLFMQVLWTVFLMYYAITMIDAEYSKNPFELWQTYPILIYVTSSFLYEGYEIYHSNPTWTNGTNCLKRLEKKYREMNPNLLNPNLLNLLQWLRNMVSKFYWSNWTNYIQWMRNLFFIAALFLPLSERHEESRASAAASVGILLSYILAMRHLRNFGKVVGESIDILRQVCDRVFWVLLSCSLILFGFTLAFVLLFSGRSNSWSSPLKSINMTAPIPFYKVIVMMNGELDFDDFSESLEFGDSSWFTQGTRNLIFLLFLVMIVLAFFNQLTGVALDKVKEFHARAEVQRVISKIEYLYFVENLLGLLHLLFSSVAQLLGRNMEVVEGFLGRFNVASHPQSGIDGQYEILPVKESDSLVSQSRGFLHFLVSFTAQLIRRSEKDIDSFLLGFNVASQKIDGRFGINQFLPVNDSDCLLQQSHSSLWIVKYVQNFPDMERLRIQDIKKMHEIAERNRRQELGMQYSFNKGTQTV